MVANLLEILDEEFKHLKFNSALADKFYRFQVGFVNKNEDHLSFFGNTITGVYTVRFSPSDTRTILEDILGSDEEHLKRLISKAPGINQDYFVSGDTFNLVMLYCVYKFMNTMYLNDKLKERACLDVSLILQYKLLTGLILKYFKYPTDMRTAQATYESLNLKFLLKRLGSWQKVMEYRAKDVYDKESPNHEFVKKFNSDNEIILVLNNLYTKLNDLVKNIYRAFDEVHRRGDKITSTSNIMVTLDGKETLKEKTHGLENYISYITSVVSDKNSFIKEELIRVILRIMQGIQEKAFRKSLEWMSDHLHDSKESTTDLFLKTVIIHAYTYNEENSSVVNDVKNLPAYLDKMRGVYMSARSTNEDLFKIRELGEEIVKSATGSTNAAAISTVRTGVLLYVCLRTFTKHYYS